MTSYLEFDGFSVVYPVIIKACMLSFLSNTTIFTLSLFFFVSFRLTYAVVFFKPYGIYLYSMKSKFTIFLLSPFLKVEIFLFCAFFFLFFSAFKHFTTIFHVDWCFTYDILSSKKKTNFKNNKDQSLIIYRIVFEW